MLRPYPIIDDGPMIRLAPDDVETAQVAGVQFARALAGAPTVTFMAALGEQYPSGEDPGR